MAKCVGLFGTCGDSNWREGFIKKFEELGINFFNPQVKNWTPDFAEIEAEHLATDEIILFPVTGETYGFGSLAEIGFAVAQCQQENRHLIVFVDQNLVEDLEDVLLRKESNRARKLVAAHLNKIDETKPENIHVVKDLGIMLELARVIYFKDTFSH